MSTPTKYTYAFSAFPNNRVEPTSLSLEIAQSSIVIALDHIDTNTACDIWFKDVLSSGDQTTLNSVVAAHQGNIATFSGQQAVLYNSTITAGSSQSFTGFVNRQANLFINVKNSPTGTSPGLQFTLQEVDPGDLTTIIGTTVTGLSITAAGTQELTLNLTTSTVVKVSWIIVGSNSPTFTGVYVTLTSKPTTTISGVDVNGVERILRPDTSGRLLVSGSNAINTAVTVDPIIIGGVNPGGVAGYAQLASDDSIIVTDGGNYQPIFLNATVNSSSNSTLTNIGDGAVHLFINVKNAPTGTNPTLTFTIKEVDPGDKATPLRSTMTGSDITAAGTQVLVLPMVSSGVVLVSWTIGGTASPTFTGVYVTAICKPTPTSVYGDFYSASINSMVYSAATATAGVAPGTAIGTTAPFTLYNPKTSTRNLVVLEARMSYVSGTLGSGTCYLVANNNPAASAVTGTTITPTCNLINSGTVSPQAKAFTTSTLPATPTVLEPLWTLTPILATSVFPPYELEDDLHGRFIIAPGCSLSVESVAGSGSTPKVVFGMSWIEVPF